MRTFPDQRRLHGAGRTALRISVVTETDPPEVNGVALTTARIIEGLRARRHEVQLVRPRQSKDEEQACTLHFQEVLLPGLPIPGYPSLKMGLPSRPAHAQLWTANRPDIVHIATEGPLGWSALRAALQLQLPVSSGFRTNFHAYSTHCGVGWLSRPIMAYLRRFHNRADCTMVPTEALRRSLFERGFRNLIALSRGVDTQLFSPERRNEDLRCRWGVAPDALAVLHVGRLAWEKNLSALARLDRVMRATRSGAKLVVVGDGPARQWLQAECPEAHFAGMRTGADLATHYASGDLFFFPSMTETFGNVTAEAMASGLPVFAFDYAAVGMLIRSGENGVVAPFGETWDLLARTVELIKDPARLREFGMRARTTACTLDWGRIVEQIELVFQAISGEGRRDRWDVPAAARHPAH